MNVLIIEDSKVCSQYLTEVMHSWRINVTVSEELVSDCDRYDLVLCDLMLEESTSRETLDWIVNQGEHTPIVVVTGTIDMFLAHRLGSCGIAFLIKPPEERLLRNVVCWLYGQRGIDLKKLDFLIDLE